MTLKTNLKSALTRARADEDREFVFASEGLTVRVLQARSGYVILTLERRDTAPTDADWQRVVSAWPEPGPAGIVPRPATAGKLHALVGRWPRPAVIETI